MVTMRPMLRALAALAALWLGPTLPATGAPADGAAAELPRVLVFSRTAGFRHASIPDGIRAVREIGSGRWTVDATEDSAAFTPGNLGRYRAVVFLSTTGNVLDEAQQRALEGYVRAGGGWAGIHAATDTEYDWPWYGRLAGAWFSGHPPVQPATVRVEDRAHRSTRMLPAEWRRTDEWYAFRSSPRGTVRVLASLDEASYEPGKAAMGDHPIAWCHEFDGGRSWYTAGGHTSESFAEPLFREHLREGIEWAMGLPERPAAAVPSARAATGGPLLAAAPAAPATLAAIPTGIALVGAYLVAAVVLGATGQGVKAPLLGWLLPGLGHWVLGYRRRAALAMTAVAGMFACGLAVGGIDAVDSVEDGPWFIAQAGYGPAALAADWANQAVLKSGLVGELLPAVAPADPLGRPVPGRHTMSSFKALGAANEFGTLFIALGGMMNLVLVMDASRREPAERPDA